MNAHAFGMPQGRTLTPQSLARQMLDEADGDITKATTKLVNYASNIASYRDEMMHLAARTILNAMAGQQRATIRAAEVAKPAFVMSPAVKAAQARARRAGHINRSVLLDMEYQIGSVVKPLRSWRGVDIEAHGEVQLASARTSAKRAQFLIAVGRAAGENEVGSLGDATVEKIHAEAMKSADKAAGRPE